MATYQVKGAAGQPLNATLRTVESINAASWELALRSLAADTFVWTAATEGPDGTGTIIPAAGQRVEFWVDGVRKFRGEAARPRVGLNSVTVECVGPWWWMERIDLSGTALDGEGTSGDRTSYVFPTQGIKTSLEDLIDRMITMGVPIQRGTISTGFNVPKMTLSNMSFAAALAELMRWLPDAVAWFDYEDDTIPPVLKITRRDDMADLEFTYGTTRFESVDIAPRLEQEVDRVSLRYVTRNAVTGKPKWASQSSGPTTTGKIQIITVSGPEIVDYLPKDDFASKSLRTVEATSITDDYVAANDSQLAAILKEYGLTGSVGNFFRTYSGDTNAAGGVTNLITTNHSFPSLTFQRDNGNYLTNLTGKFLIVSADLPQWVKEQWKGIDVTISGTWISFWDYAVQGNYFSDGFDALRSGAQVGSGEFSASLNGNRKAWAARPFTCRGVLIEAVTGLPDNPPWATNKTVYKQWDYDYLSPPSGLAAELQAAQTWVPWEGSFSYVGDGISGTNHVRRKINIANGWSEWATMNALVKAVRFNALGRTTFELGSPARIDFASLVGRIRREPQDNIVYL